jgi:DNA-binding protein H-NS
MYQEYIDTAAALIDACKMDDVTRDVAVIQEKLDLTKHRWAKIKQLTEERKEQMHEAQKLVKKFQSIISPYEDTLRSCEKRSQKPRELGSEPEALQNYLNKLQVIKIN